MAAAATSAQASSTTGVESFREEPYLEQHRLDKPALDYYESPHVDWAMLEAVDQNAFAWIRAPASVFVDAEAYR